MRASRQSCKLAIWGRDDTLQPTDAYGDGAQANPPAEIGACWAAIYPIRGAELERDESRQSITRCRIVTSWFEGKDLSAAMYFTYGDRKFDIISVERDDVTRRNVVFICLEKPMGA